MPMRVTGIGVQQAMFETLQGSEWQRTKSAVTADLGLTAGLAGGMGDRRSMDYWVWWLARTG